MKITNWKNQSVEAVSAFLLGVAGGWVIWWSSSALWGLEPWDNNIAMYVIALFLVGLIVSLICIRHVWWVWLVGAGMWTGQVGFMLAHTFSALLIVGLVYVFLFSIITVLGAALGYYVLRSLIKQG